MSSSRTGARGPGDVAEQRSGRGRGESRRAALAARAAARLGWHGAQLRGRAGAGRLDGAERVAPGGGAADGGGVRLGARVGGGAEQLGGRLARTLCGQVERAVQACVCGSERARATQEQARAGAG
jgi:hypothetical protein